MKKKKSKAEKRLRNGKVLVENEPIYTLTYSDPEDESDLGTLEVAKKLATMIDINTEKVTDRDKKDYWILELQYEELLKGKKEQQTFVTNRQGENILLNLVLVSRRKLIYQMKL